MSRTIEALYKVAAKYTDLLQGRGAPAVAILRPRIMEWEGSKKFIKGKHYVADDTVAARRTPTIAYGFTDPKVIAKWGKTGMPDINAQAYLSTRLNDEHRYFSERYPHYNKLSPYQQAALISLRYNIGSGNFYKSDARRYLQSGAINKIPASIASHNSVHKYDPSFTKDTPGVRIDSKGRYYKPTVIPGLDNRRKAEIALWNHPWLPEPEFTPHKIAPIPEPELPGTTTNE